MLKVCNHRVWIAAGLVLVTCAAESEAGKHKKWRGGSSGGSSGKYDGHYKHHKHGSSGFYGSSGGFIDGGSSGGFGYGGSSGGYGGSSGGYGFGGSSGGYGGSSGAFVPGPAVAPPPPGVPMTSRKGQNVETGRGQLVMEVPQDAKVFLVNQPMQLTGATRKFSTPPIQVGRQYEIPIRVELTRGDKTVQVTGRQLIQAGQTVKVVVTMSERGELQIAPLAVADRSAGSQGD